MPSREGTGHDGSRAGGRGLPTDMRILSADTTCSTTAGARGRVIRRRPATGNRTPTPSDHSRRGSPADGWYKAGRSARGPSSAADAATRICTDRGVACGSRGCSKASAEVRVQALSADVRRLPPDREFDASPVSQSGRLLVPILGGNVRRPPLGCEPGRPGGVPKRAHSAPNGLGAP